MTRKNEKFKSKQIIECNQTAQKKNIRHQKRKRTIRSKHVKRRDRKKQTDEKAKNEEEEYIIKINKIIR